MMADILSFVQLSAGTAFAMPAAPLAVFVHYLTAGQQYMLRAGKGVQAGANFLIPPRGRELSRTVGAGKETFPGADVIAGIPALLDLLPTASTAAAALRLFLLVLKGERSPITATVTFPDSDYTVHHRLGFSQDVRTWSTRTESAECVNQENLLGEHLANGVSYTLIDGDEYRLRSVEVTSTHSGHEHSVAGSVHVCGEGPAVAFLCVCGFVNRKQGAEGCCMTMYNVYAVWLYD